MSHARRWTSVLALSALTALAPLSAQENPFELSLIAVPGGSYSEYDDFDFDMGYGVGVGWAFAEDWSAELRGLRRESDSTFEMLELDSFELGLRRHFSDGAWRPFVQLGALHQTGDIERQVVCTQPVTDPCPPLTEERSESGAFVGGGVDWNFSSRAALRLDGRALFYESDRTGDTDDRVEATAGIVLRF